MESSQIMVHVRFNPNGTVMEISECPAAATSQQWFDYLSRNTLDQYASLSGGRGFFKVAPEDLAALKASCCPN